MIVIMAGLPGTGRLVGFSAADLASNTAIPVMVQLTPQPAGYAELADRRAGRPKWDVAKRQSAEAADDFGSLMDYAKPFHYSQMA